MRHRRSGFQMRYFHCPVCHTVIAAPKSKNFSENGHKKHMYCYICQEVRRFKMDSEEKISF